MFITGIPDNMTGWLGTGIESLPAGILDNVSDELGILVIRRKFDK